MEMPAANMNDSAQRVPEGLPGPSHALMERFSQINQQTRRLIRENPTVALVGALTFGYVIGRWASRSSFWSRP